MKVKSIVLGLLLTVAMISCKNEPKAAEEVAVEKPVENAFVVMANMNVKEDDNFQIYYIESVGEPLDPKKYVSVSVKGSQAPQDVVFKLPENAILADMRFDLGDNKKQTDVKINTIKFDYLGKSFTCRESQVDFYFGYNEQVVLDKKTGAATFKEMPNQPHDPMLLAKSTLKDELAKLYK